jgi:phosphopantothenoylcysteine synthetase/decarboxylase
MTSKKDSANAQVFEGKHFLITSGPIRGPIDAVRYISSTSTGKLGSLMATEALRRGAQVTFVYGEGSARPEPEELEAAGEDRFTARPVVTFDDMMKVFSQELGSQKHDVVLHAMAVLDYVPETKLSAKTPSGKDQWTIKLVPTPKLIQIVKRLNPEAFLVGFKLEVGANRGELVKAARLSAERSGASLVVANELGMIQRGEHQAAVVNARGEVEMVLNGKEQIARGLMELIAAKLKGGK